MSLTLLSYDTMAYLTCCRHLYAIARNVQKHHRLIAVMEALDNGKSVRETRDCDVPLVARHFYHHAGWAQLGASEMSNWKPVGKKWTQIL